MTDERHHERRFFLRMSFHDNEGHTFADRAMEIDSAWCGHRPSFTNLSPPTRGLGASTFDEVVDILRVKELRRKEFIRDATRMGHALADFLEDKEGWHGIDRQERIEKLEKEGKL